MVALISFITLILIVVSVHEYGHYWAARRCGVRVLRFSVGFGKPLYAHRDARGTEWVIAPIPLGGYVQMLDRNTAQREGYPLAESIDAQSHPRRIFVYLAGPLANLLLSVLVAMLLYAGGQQGLRPLVDHVRAYSPASDAGVHAGSELAAVNGRAVMLWRQVQVALTDAIISGDEITLRDINGNDYPISGAQLSINDLEQPGGAASALGMYPYEGYIKTQIEAVVPDSPAAQAGVRPGDDIVMMGTVVVDSWRDVVSVVAEHQQTPLPLLLWRDNAALTITVTPAPGRGGREFSIGVVLAIDRAELAENIVTISYSLPGLAAAAVSETAADASRAVSFLGQLLSGGASSRHVSGPLGIAVQSGEAAALGVSAWLRFITLISTSLAVLNLLPLPLLDGGHIVLSALQWAMRRDLSSRLMHFWNVGGAVLILMIIGFAVINDIIRLLF